MKLVVLSLTSILYIPLVTKAQNKLSRKEKKAGWTLLFDGKTTTGWRDAYKDTVPKASWKIVEGAMMVLPKREGETTGRGDIVTNKLYSNFELSIDFKLTEGTNSGIKYFVDKALGLEYQVIDDKRHRCKDGQERQPYPCFFVRPHTCIISKDGEAHGRMEHGKNCIKKSLR